MKPRAILWDLFGDHLRYAERGVVPMRALNQLLELFGVGESTSRVVLSRMRRRAGSPPAATGGRPATR